MWLTGEWEGVNTLQGIVRARLVRSVCTIEHPKGCTSVTTCVFISILCQFVESGVGCCVVLLGVWLPDAFDLNPVSQELAEW